MMKNNLKKIISMEKNLRKQTKKEISTMKLLFYVNSGVWIVLSVLVMFFTKGLPRFLLVCATISIMSTSFTIVEKLVENLDTQERYLRTLREVTK